MKMRLLSLIQGFSEDAWMSLWDCSSLFGHLVEEELSCGDDGFPYWFNRLRQCYELMYCDIPLRHHVDCIVFLVIYCLAHYVGDDVTSECYGESLVMHFCMFTVVLRVCICCTNQYCIKSDSEDRNI